MRLKYTMKPDEKATFTTATANDKPVLTFDVVITEYRPIRGTGDRYRGNKA